ncbi:FAD-binding protein [Nocardia sp. CY41]|uniref:FAD-binding protein n=1 Tax=Nocardia sp. CY41 TaxID=2608686 RepID=UPI00135910FB
MECAFQSSVQAVVRHAADLGVPVAVRGGGYSVGGLGTVAGGIVVSLARLSSIDVDRASAQVCARAGVRAGQRAAALDAAGLWLRLFRAGHRLSGPRCGEALNTPFASPAFCATR